MVRTIYGSEVKLMKKVDEHHALVCRVDDGKVLQCTFGQLRPADKEGIRELADFIDGKNENHCPSR